MLSIQIDKIVNLSANLYERLSGQFIPSHNSCNAGDNTEIDYRLERWCYSCSNGNQDGLSARLAHDGFDINTIRPLFGSVVLAPAAPMPSWSTIIEGCVDLAREFSFDQASSYQATIFTDTFSFTEILIPFVQFARNKLTKLINNRHNLLTDIAIRHLEYHLLVQLSFISRQTLECEFSIFHTQSRSSIDRILRAESTELSKHIYYEFMENLFRGGLVELFTEYTVLARLIGTTIDQWVEFVAEFLLRLNLDLSELSDVFNHSSSLGRVTTILAGISDNHNNGRSVLRVKFEAGIELIYKPKNVELELVFAQFQEWLNAFADPAPFKPLEIVARTDYGWVECVKHLACSSDNEVQRFFLRCGMLLCLIYVLGGTDCHYENIIASGEYPQLIDVETLMHHRLEAADALASSGARVLADLHVWRSVLRTALLPHWTVDKDGKSIDLSGLGWESRSSSFQKRAFPDSSETSINTSNHGNRRQNLPFMESEQSITANNYLKEILSGFEQMYKILVEKQKQLLEPNGWIQKLFNQQVRFVMRPTQAYGKLLRNTLDPGYLRQGLDRSIELDAISRAFIQSGANDTLWPILRLEHMSLERMDVPYFVALPTKRDIETIDGEVIPDCFDDPSSLWVTKTIEDLSEEDLDFQKNLIITSFDAYSAEESKITVQGESNFNSIQEEKDFNILNLTKYSVMIADQLAKSAICASDRSITWIALQLHPQVERYQLRQIGHDLYGGTAGIGLFFAAVYALTNNPEYASIALSSVESTRKMIRSVGERFIAFNGIGGFTGIGSIIYTLTCLGYLLNDERCIDDAYIALRVVNDRIIERDTNYDIISGSAGLMLASLTLYKKTQSPRVKEYALHIAKKCGDDLLENRLVSLSGHRTWPSFDKKLFTGFSHGAAGITYSLLKLYQVTADIRYLEAAREGIRYERSVFVPEVGNWLDHETKPDEVSDRHFSNQWCHGAFGIGLARASSLCIEDSPEIRNDIDNVISVVLKSGFAPFDHLCCGTMGQIRILFEIAKHIGRRDLEHLARNQLQKNLQGIGTQTDENIIRWRITHPNKNPGFMRGISGIGYCLVEMADIAERIPEALLIEC